MAEIKNIYFIGIAGSGMSGLALMAQAEGFNVAGSDQQSSLYLQAVLAAGIPVTLEQKAANILERDIDVVVVSAAIKEDNPELACARQRGLPIWPRARMLAWLGRDKRTWAVAGTHGKTTTSSMLASTLANLGADPSWLVGGVLVEYEATARLGQGPDYVIEADESDESFTQLRPYWMIITNIEPDHLDHYPDLAAIDQAFAAFLATLEPNGRVIYCREDAGLTQLVAESGQPAISYGFRADADYRAEPLDQGFLVHGPAGLRLPLQIPAAPGLHNILNATAVVASLMEAGFEPSAIARALAAFQGVHRRFELIGEAGGVQVADDYGHHPTEIKATLAAARRMGYRRIHLLFQPHRYTRTQQLFPDFVNTFDDVDSLVLLDIYPAGEAAIPGVNSQKLLAAIQAAHPGLSTESALDWEAVPALLAGRAAAGDLILTMGAGTVTKLAPQILAALQSGQTAGPREEGSAEATDYQAGDSNPGLPAPASDQSAGAAAVPSTVSRQAAPTFEAYCELEGAIRGTVLLNEPMSRHTSFRIGGPAALFIECSNLNDLQTALSVIERYGLDWTTLGKGSNLLVSDQGFGGAVLTLGREFKAYRFPQDEQHNSATEAPAALVAKSLESSGGGALLVSGAGVLLGDLVRGAFKNGYSGLEFAVGIPGTVGGALFMNAGSAEVWISAITASILVLRPGHGLLRYAAADLNWGYRSSGLPSGEVILESTLVIQPGNASHIRARMEAATRRRQKTQPLNLPSAGSVFRNPDGGNAGQLIDALGLKGLTIGGASISTVHANFIVNQGQAKAVDVVALIQEVRRRVKESYGFELHTEIRFLGFH